jgi:hypothetical protein
VQQGRTVKVLTEGVRNEAIVENADSSRRIDRLLAKRTRRKKRDSEKGKYCCAHDGNIYSWKHRIASVVTGG